MSYVEEMDNERSRLQKIIEETTILNNETEELVTILKILKEHNARPSMTMASQFKLGNRKIRIRQETRFVVDIADPDDSFDRWWNSTDFKSIPSSKLEEIIQYV